MLTVAILINGNPIMARSAVRGERSPDGRIAYLVDDGATIQHDPDDGAVALAQKLLDRIVEQGAPSCAPESLRPSSRRKISNEPRSRYS